MVAQNGKTSKRGWTSMECPGRSCRQSSRLMQDKDPVKVKKVTEALFKMVKLDIEGLKRAYNS